MVCSISSIMVYHSCRKSYIAYQLDAAAPLEWLTFASNRDILLSNNSSLSSHPTQSLVNMFFVTTIFTRFCASVWYMHFVFIWLLPSLIFILKVCCFWACYSWLCAGTTAFFVIFLCILPDISSLISPFWFGVQMPWNLLLLYSFCFWSTRCASCRLLDFFAICQALTVHFPSLLYLIAPKGLFQAPPSAYPTSLFYLHIPWPVVSSSGKSVLSLCFMMIPFLTKTMQGYWSLLCCPWISQQFLCEGWWCQTQVNDTIFPLLTCHPGCSIVSQAE